MIAPELIAKHGTSLFLTSQVTNLSRFSSAEALIREHGVTLSLLVVVHRVFCPPMAVRHVAAALF